MSKITMYHSNSCPYCVRTEQLLRQRGVQQITKLNIEEDASVRAEMMARSARRTVPQIFIGERHVGGHDDLLAMDQRGELSPLLAAL